MAQSSQPFHLVLIIHAHQPSGNFQHVFEECYKNAYLAFLDLLEQHPTIRAGLHYSGPLLLWIEKNRPNYLLRLRQLVSSGQIELIGGGFYEPILISIPESDQIEQLTRLADYIEKHFRKRPTGCWLAERVWEPQLPFTLAAANVAYTLVDDLPFLAAGFEPEELFGSYIVEDRGKTVWLFPGLKELRYLIPFRKVEESVEFFSKAAQIRPGGVAFFGDDMEKFGVWPGTFEHCYVDGWLESFFTALEENSSWLKTITPSDYVATHLPCGRADLPTASYAEMMEWVLPTKVRQRYATLHKEFAGRPDLLTLFRGGAWRGFFCKYPESNLMHKKMLRVSARVASIPRRSSSGHSSQVLEARDLVLRGQSNDAYWHGIFGGLYAPHLRREIWHNLIRAETLADQLTPGGMLPRVELLDYDADGAPELLFTAPEYQALLKPSDGATLSAFDFRTAAASIINSVRRRPEAYHTRLREAATTAACGPAGAVSIHDQVRVKEPNLERFLHYDRFPRNSFRILLFDPSRAQPEYDALQLEELASVAGGAFQIRNSSADYAVLALDQLLPEYAADPANPPRLRITKRFLFGPAPQGCEVSCDVELSLSKTLSKPLLFGLESIINFLAPTDSDRFFETPEGHKNLRFSGSLPGPLLHMEDGWQRVRASLHAPSSSEFWIAPIETVSESEGGFERVYQGSQILALWRPDLTVQTIFSSRLLWRLASF